MISRIEITREVTNARKWMHTVAHTAEKKINT